MACRHDCLNVWETLGAFNIDEGEAVAGIVPLMHVEFTDQA